MATFKETVSSLEKWYHKATISDIDKLSEIDRNIVFLAVEVARHDTPSSVRKYNYALELISEIEKLDSEYHKEFVQWMKNDIESFYQPAQSHCDFMMACSNEQ